MSIIRLVAVAYFCVALTGCASSGSRWNPFARRDDRDTAVARKKLKDPHKLDLAYAKWQEQIGNTTEARERYQRVLHDEPHSVPAMLGLARLDQLGGKMAEAEQGYRKSLKAAPNDPLVLDALGQFYATQEKWPLAIDTLRQALQSSPNDNTIRFHLAVAMAKSGDIAGSKPHFVNAVGDAEADYNLGLILHDQGKLEQAEQFFVQAAVKKPTLEQAQYWLSEIRVEKETKQLLSGTSGTNGRPRPEMQAPAGALPTSTHLQSLDVKEHRLTPQDVLQTSGQQSLGNAAGDVTPAMGGSTLPNMDRLPTNASAASRSSGISNPFGTGSLSNSNSVPQAGLTPQQIEQLRNQR